MVKLLQHIHIVDLWTFDWCLKRKHRQLLVATSRWVSRSADGHLYALLGLLCGVTQQWLLFTVLTLGFAMERSVYFLLKNQLKRNRPQQAIPGYRSVIQPSDQFSFPSGHTSAAFMITGVLTAFFPTLLLPLTLWSLWVGVSRVMLGVHFPTDTVAGALLGFGISQLALTLLQ